MPSSDPQQGAFGRALGELGPATLGALAALESARRALHPPTFEVIRRQVLPLRERLDEARARFSRVAAPAGLEAFAQQLAEAADHAAQALLLIASDAAPGDPMGGVARVLQGMRRHSQAEAALYPLRTALPPVSRFFLEPGFHQRLDELDPADPVAGTGLHRARGSGDERGGFSLYVPESYDGASDWPLVVALHGGSGHGDDFLWTWLREARGRRCLLLCPTSQGSTWSLHAPPIDTHALHSMLTFIVQRWRVDPERVLLTGLSDGATFTLLCGLAQDSPFTALAPISGVLHPMNFANGNIERALGRRIYLVHGALDWMFPVETARTAADALRAAGAVLEYREIEDLSHTYPREENARILEWFDPSLPVPGDASPC